MPGAIHHSVVVVADLKQSLRLYRDGLGLDVLVDREVEGDWPGLFDAPARRVRAVFLGDASAPDVFAGVLELNYYLGADVAAGTPSSPKRTGFLLLSFFADVDLTLGRWRASASAVRRDESRSRHRTVRSSSQRCATPTDCWCCSRPVRSPGHPDCAAVVSVVGSAVESAASIRRPALVISGLGAPRVSPHGPARRTVPVMQRVRAAVLRG